MDTIRCWYTFLVSAVSLQSVTWAIIGLLRNLLLSAEDVSRTAVSFQIAVIVIGLPIFLGHWLWAQHLAGENIEERDSAVRHFYLYGMMAAFLIPFVFTLTSILRRILGELFNLRIWLGPEETIPYELIGALVVALLGYYHWRIVHAERDVRPEVGRLGDIRRLFIYAFSGLGAAMFLISTIHLLRWLLWQISAEGISSASNNLALDLANLLVGLPLWLLFWRRGQTLFFSTQAEEIASALRKLYLYLAAFVSAFAAVGNGTLILAGLLRRLMGLPSLGDIREPLPIVLVAVLSWVYHARVIRADAATTTERQRQAQIRRIYHYLIAALGLAAFLVGVAGNIFVLIELLGPEIWAAGIKEAVAWFTAAIIAGLPVWYVPWRLMQRLAGESGESGDAERRALVRKIYLYLYLFVAAITVLSAAIYVVTQLVSLLLGGREAAGLLSDLSEALAFMIIGVVVWLYHAYLLRQDGRESEEMEAARLRQMHVTVVDVGDGHLGHALVDALKQQLPAVQLQPLGLNPRAAAAMNGGHLAEEPLRMLAESEVIVGPWTVAVPGAAGGQVSSELAQAVQRSAARKVLLPVRDEGWEWAGVDDWDMESVARQTADAIRQMAAGEKVHLIRPLGVGSIIAIVIGVMVLLGMLVFPLMMLLEEFL